MAAYVFLFLATLLAAGMRRRNPFRPIVFGLTTLYIVGLKYEVGFDWYVYSEQFRIFSDMSFSEFFGNISYQVAYHAQEPLFLVLSFLSAKTLGVYEIFQCVAYGFFVWSVFFLGRSVGRVNVIAAFIPIHLFLLFTLEFSTLRQMIALALFHISLGLFLSGKSRKSYVFAALAPFIQASSAIFALVTYWTAATSRMAKIWLLAGGLAVVIVNVVGFGAILSNFGGFFPRVLADKIYYYTEVREYGFSIAEQAFSVVFYIAAIVFSSKNRRHVSPRIRFVSTLVLYLSILALAGFAIPTLRNRMLYEIVVLVSLLMFTRGIIFRKTARMVLIPMGILFFAVSLTKQTSFAFVPYQNYVWYQVTGQESDGYARQQRILDIVRNR